MRSALLISLLLLSLPTFAQTQSGNTGGMDMSNMGSGNGPGMATGGNAEAMHSMEGRHMDMGPHMKMTALRPTQPGDDQRAARVAEAARAVAEKYKDYRIALADGYQIFLPNVPQKQYHFTNYANASQARHQFDPSKPTSLLYKKDGDGYKLIGVMYTAKKDATEDELDARVPLSIAQWHAHVNLCLPPHDTNPEDVLPAGTKFGLRGSIATREQCEAAGGKFFPQVFGWMVHVYPFEQNQADIWSVERQTPPKD